MNKFFLFLIVFTLFAGIGFAENIQGIEICDSHTSGIPIQNVIIKDVNYIGIGDYGITVLTVYSKSAKQEWKVPFLGIYAYEVPLNIPCDVFNKRAVSPLVSLPKYVITYIAPLS